MDATKTTLLLARYATVTDELRTLYLDQGVQRSNHITTYREAWEGAVSYGVTERNKLAQCASDHLAAVLANMEGQIQSALAELRYLDRCLEHG